MRASLLWASAAAVLVCLWILGRAGSDPVPSAPTLSSGGRVDSAATAAAAMPTGEGAAAQRLPVAQPASLPAVIDPSAMSVVGRCVDARGHPVAQAMVRWLRPCGVTISSISSADGSWQLRAPATRGVWVLRCGHPDFVAIERTGSLSPVLPTDGTIRLGDVVLPAGRWLTIRVRDARGVPASACQLVLTRPSDGEVPVGTPLALDGTTGPDGDCRLGPLLPGLYTAEVIGNVLEGPANVPVTGDCGEQFATLTIAVPGDLRRIRGRVIDANGQPVAGAAVGAFEDRRPVSAAVCNVVGEFVLAAACKHATTPVQLAAGATGHDVAEGITVAWGSEDVVLGLPRGAALALTVTDDTGAPISDFHFTLRRIDGVVGFGDQIHDLEGPHANGLVSLAGLARGEYEAKFEREHRGRSVAVLVPLAIHADTVVQTVQMPRIVTRDVRFLDPDHAPIVGCMVELLAGTGGVVMPESPAVGPDEPPRSRQAGACLLVDRAVTDLGGRVRLVGPVGNPRFVRASGVGPLPEVLEVAWNDDSALTVTLARAHRAITVQIEPADAAQALADAWPDCALALVPASKSARAGLLARSLSRPLHAPFCLQFAAGEPAAEPWLWTPVGRVRMATRSLDGPLHIDVAALHPAKLEGTVLLDDEPASYLGLRIDRLPDAGGDTKTLCPPRLLGLDGRGGYACTLLPGRYRVRLLDGSSGAGSMATTSPIELGPGEERRLQHLVNHGGLRLRLRTPDGAPARDVSALQLLRGIDRSFVQTLPPTDAEGCTRLERCEVGDLVVRVLPHRLGTSAQRTEYGKRTGNPAALESEYLEVVRFRIDPRAVAEVTATLPPEWLR